MHVAGIEIGKQCFRSRPHTHALLQLLRAAMRHPGNLRRKSLDMILFLLQQALRNQARQVYILNTGLLEPSVQLLLDILPDRVTGRLDHHESLELRISRQLCLFDNVRVPLGEVLLHRSDLLDKLFFLCHAVFSLPVLFSLLFCPFLNSRGIL